MGNNEEVWKEHPVHKNYFLSNMGNVRRGEYVNTLGRRFKPYQKKKTKNSKGYHTSCCMRKNYLVHRLVAETFIPNPEGKPHINHINGIKTDNRVENLEWCTPKENLRHAVETGLYIATGEHNGRCKITEADAREIKYGLKDKTRRELSERFGISMWMITAIRNNRLWKHI